MKRRAIAGVAQALLLCGMLQAVSVRAQTDAPAETAEEPTGRQIEEVVVTARRVEENLQDVPLAVTALSGRQLEKAGVEAVADLSKAVPSVQISPTTGRKQAVIFGIRGQRADDVLLTQDQAVGVYINDVAQGWPYGIGQSGILDVASLQVAKGPQGTLFGKNTTGGAIIITPSAPKDYFEAGGKLGYGSFNTLEGEGILNTPFGDRLAARLAVGYARSDGTFENPDVGGDFAGQDDLSARLSVLWTPTGAVSSLFVAHLFDSDTDSGVPVKLTAVNPNSPLDRAIGAAIGVPDFSAYAGYYTEGYAQQQSEDFFTAHTDEDQFMKTRTWGFTNTTSFVASDALTVKNIASVSRLDLDGLVDLDGVNGNAIPLRGSFPEGHPAAGVPYAAVLSTRFSSQQITQAEQVTEELQLIGAAGRVDWIGGIYYSLLDGKDYSFSNQYSATRTLTGAEGGLTNESFAVFGQLTAHLTDTLNLTGGLRYTRDQREIIATARSTAPATDTFNPCSLTDPAYVSDDNPTGKLPADQCRIQSNADFGQPTWTVSLDWKATPDHLLYVAHRRGYRAGAFSGRGTSRASLQAADPETVDDFEIGSKSDFRFGSQFLRINAALFHQDYEDVQRNLTLVEGGLLKTTVVNAATATLQGGELELSYIPVDALELFVSYAYVDASYDEWDVPSLAVPGAVIDRSPNRFATVPEHTANVTARYTLPLSDRVGALAVSGNVYTQSDTALYVDNAVDGFGLECEGSTQGGYTLLNARIDWTDVLGRAGLDAALWGKNLTDEEYFNSGLCLYNQTGFAVAYPGDPATVGVSVAYRFGR
jgi:iron complex outermembrane recepter protein